MSRQWSEGLSSFVELQKNKSNCQSTIDNPEWLNIYNEEEEEEINKEFFKSPEVKKTIRKIWKLKRKHENSST